MTDLLDDQPLATIPKGSSVISAHDEQRALDVLSRLDEMYHVVRPTLSRDHKSVVVKTTPETTIRLLRSVGFKEFEIESFGFKELMKKVPLQDPLPSEGSFCANCGIIDVAHVGSEYNCPNCGEPMTPLEALDE